MIGVKLEYQIKKSENLSLGDKQNSFRVYVYNPFFCKTIKLQALDKFPKNRICEYQYQSHAKYVEFTSLNPNQTKSQTQEFMNEISNLISQISVVVAHNNKIIKNNYIASMIKLLNFSASCGYKLVRKPVQNFKEGDLVIFFTSQRRQAVKQLVDSIRGFGDKIIGFPLEERIKKYKIPEDYVRNVFKQVINCYGSEIEASANFYQINVIYIGVCRRSIDQESGATPHWFLTLYVEGNLTNTHEFYLSLEHIIESIPLFFIKFSWVRSIKSNQIHKNLPYENECRMLDGQYMIIMDRNISEKQIYDLKIGSYILDQETISKEDRNILSVEIKTQRFKKFTMQNELNIESMNITEEHIVVQCPHEELNRNVRYLNKYASQFQYQSVECAEFQVNSLITNIFFRIYKERIEKQINISFEIVQGKLVRKNFTLDSQKVIFNLQSIRQEIISQFINIPTLKPISTYQAKVNNIEGMYVIEKNPTSFWQKSLRSVKYNILNKTSLVLTQFDNLYKYQKKIIFIIHNDLPVNSKIFQILKANKIDVNKFFQNLRGVRPKRVKSHKTENSLKFKEITLLYFDVKRINSRHIDEDIQNCFKQYQDEKNISMLIGLSSKRFIEQIFGKLLQKLHGMLQKHEIKLQQLVVYYEQLPLLPQLQRVIVNSKNLMPLISRDCFNQWSLLKMNNLKQYVLSYYWNKDTYTLPGVDSYVIHFQKTISPKGRALVTIPLQLVLQKQYKQFFIDYKTERVLEIYDFTSIHSHHLHRMSKRFQLFVRLIKQNFSDIHFFVAYASNNLNQIGQEVCLNIYYINGKNQQLSPLIFNLKQFTITLNKQGEHLPYIINKKAYVDWFKVFTHGSLCKEIEKCLQK